MSNDRRPRASDAGALGDHTRTVVQVTSPPIIQGELKLSDGTVLNIMLVIPAVTRLDGLKTPQGAPMYEIQSSVVVGVKHFEKTDKTERGH